jgi:hypothetical protein
LSERHHSLRFLSGRAQGSEYVLGDPSEVVVGRSGDADLILIEGMVSRRHARFTLEEGVLEVEDLGSTNGTFVNGEKVKKKRLAEGDRVLVGTSILKVVRSESPVGTVPPAPDLSQLNDQQTADRDRMSGDLAEVSVLELLELFSSSGQDVLLELLCDGAEGFIALSQGRALDCGYQKLARGTHSKVLMRLLGYNRGSFYVRPYKRPDRPPLDMAVAELLVATRAKMDELDVLRQRLPDVHESVVIARPLVPALSALDEADLALLQLAHNAGRIERILDDSEAADVDVARRLLSLVDRGYLRKA